MRSSKIGIPEELLGEWLLSKLRNYLRTEPYIRHTDWRVLYNDVARTITSSDSVVEGIEKLEHEMSKEGFSFSRKLGADEKLQVYYIPPIPFQLRSIVELWPAVSGFYKTRNNLKKLKHFGHIPNVASCEALYSESCMVRELEIALNSPLKIKFEEQYEEFKNRVLNYAKRAIEEDAEDEALVIQTDIKAFFHTLDLRNLCDAIDELAPDFAPFKKFLAIIIKEYPVDGLPVGWILSGILVDRLTAEMHLRITRELRQLESEFGSVGLLYIGASNYVDDFFCVFKTLPSVLGHEDLTEIRKKIGKSVVDKLNQIIRNVFRCQELEFYGPGTDKFQTLILTRKNIDVFETTFHAMMKGGGYQESVLGKLADLDDQLLPVDNDLIINERAYFSVMLDNLRNRIIDGGLLEKKDVNQMLDKVINRMSGGERKYVGRIIEILEVLYFDRPDEFASEVDGRISQIIQILEGSGAPFEIWIRFIDRLSKMFARTNYSGDFDFERYLSQIEGLWRSRVKVASHDLDLLQSIRVKVELRKALAEAHVVEIVARNSGPVNYLMPYRFGDMPIMLEVDVGPKASPMVGGLIEVLKVQMSSFTEPSVAVQILASTVRAIAKSESRSWTVMSVLPSVRFDSLDQFERAREDLNDVIATHERSYLLEVSNLLRSLAEYSSYQDKLLLIRHALDGARQALAVNADRKPKTMYYSADVCIALSSTSFSDRVSSYFAFFNEATSRKVFIRRAYPQTLISVGSGFYKILSLIADSRIVVRTALPTDAKLLNDKIDKIIQGEYERYDVYDPMAIAKVDRTCSVDVDCFLFLDKKIEEHEWWITLSPLAVKEEDFNPEAAMCMKTKSRERINLEIRTALNEARRRKSSLIVFPELSVPRKYLNGYLRQISRENHRMMFVGGLEYKSDSLRNAYNSTVLAIPVDPKKDPFGYSTLVFEQIKCYPAAVENYALQKEGYAYKPGDNTFIFTSETFGNFAILTCSDFLSLKLRWKVQERIQFLLVPAYNTDNHTYDHLAQSCIRDLHCYAVVCNSQLIGTSLVYGPFYESKMRIVLKREGRAFPEIASLKWEPARLRVSQSEDSQIPFRIPPDKVNDPRCSCGEEAKRKPKPKSSDASFYKQTPPDWGRD